MIAAAAVVPAITLVVALSSYVRLIATAAANPTSRPAPTAASEAQGGPVAAAGRAGWSPPGRPPAPATSAAEITPGRANAERLIAVTPAAAELDRGPGRPEHRGQPAERQQREHHRAGRERGRPVPVRRPGGHVDRGGLPGRGGRAGPVPRPWSCRAGCSSSPLRRSPVGRDGRAGHRRSRVRATRSASAAGRQPLAAPSAPAEGRRSARLSADGSSPR